MTVKYCTSNNLQYCLYACTDNIAHRVTDTFTKGVCIVRVAVLPRPFYLLRDLALINPLLVHPYRPGAWIPLHPSQQDSLRPANIEHSNNLCNALTLGIAVCAEPRV